MTTSMKAKPTAYNNILFRSKSEAIFAVALDLVPNLSWIYEPVITGFTFLPDFFVAHSCDYAMLDTLIVEYKPSEPSGDYLDQCCASITEYMNQPFGIRNTTMLVVFGSPYENEELQAYDVDHVGAGLVTVHTTLTALRQVWPKAKEYRFDLVDGLK